MRAGKGGQQRACVVEGGAGKAQGCQDTERRVNRSKLFENDIIRLNTWHAN